MFTFPALYHCCWLQGMRTYDYILAMKEQNQFPELDDDSDFSSDDSDFDSPERTTFVSRFICRGQNRINHQVPSYILHFSTAMSALTLESILNFRIQLFCL